MPAWMNRSNYVEKNTDRMTRRAELTRLIAGSQLACDAVLAGARRSLGMGDVDLSIDPDDDVFVRPGAFSVTFIERSHQTIDVGAFICFRDASVAGGSENEGVIWQMDGDIVINDITFKLPIDEKKIPGITLIVGDLQHGQRC